MQRAYIRPETQTMAPSNTSNTYLVNVLFLINLAFNVIANSAFKLAAASRSWRVFAAWQIVGNLAGFVTVLTLTGILHYVPLRTAFPITAGLAVIGVQVIGAKYLFGESISSGQWLGTLLVALGIILIGGR